MKVIGFLHPASYLPVHPKISVLHPQSLLVLQRLSKLIRKPLHPPFQTISRNSRTSSLRNPLTPYLKTSNGTTLLNWFPEKNLPLVKSILWPLLNKRNWTHSSRKIWRQVGSVRPNPLCHLRLSLLKRRSVLSAWFKTIELLMLSQ